MLSVKEWSNEWVINWRQEILMYSILCQGLLLSSLLSFFKSGHNFSNVTISFTRVWLLWFCRYYQSFREIDISESLLVLFSDIYYPKVSASVFLNVNIIGIWGEMQVCLLGAMLRCDALITYKCPNAAFLNSVFGQVYWFSLLSKLNSHYSCKVLICHCSPPCIPMVVS
jgi:hypothetical protein